MGVCAGIADWLRIDVNLVRLGFIIATAMTGGVVFFVYLALGIFLPVEDYNDSESVFDKFKSEYSRDRKPGKRTSNYRRGITIEDVSEEFNNLKTRVGRMEDKVFNKERDWDERFKKS